jgi:hypothetical protein
MVAGGWVRGRGGVRRSQVAREGGGEVGDGSERAGVGDAFMAKDELSVGARGQSLVGGWLGPGHADAAATSCHLRRRLPTVWSIGPHNYLW